MEQADQSALLSDDVLADALGHLTPRDLAVSRCVCKAWRDVVDARRMLRAELLPLSMAGLFINYHGRYITEFLPRPSTTGSSISGKHDYLPEGGHGSWSTVLDHCNGLLLVDDFVDADRVLYVLNPATGWRASIPPCPPPCIEMNTLEDKFLAYDPAISPQYQVFSTPLFLCNNSKDKPDPAIEQSEWPPTKCILHVFSSKIGRWEERPFAREGGTAGIVADMRQHWASDGRNAVYWRGALYVLCQTDFVMRMSLSNDKYQVIKRPMGIEEQNYPQFHLGKSEEGVYFASIHEQYRLRVWILSESCCPMEWVLKHDRDLFEPLLKNKFVASRQNYGRQVCGTWILQDIDYYYKNYSLHGHGNKKAFVKEKFEWSSEDEKFEWKLDSEDRKSYHKYIDILGFHQYKEIIFLSESIRTGLAYHLDSSKVQVLGNIYPKEYDLELVNEQFITSSFPYTPCWMELTADGEELEDHLESQHMLSVTT